MSAVEEVHTRAVGPYLLQRTLGKGQTGLVKLGVHCVSRKTVAVKIINRERLSKSVLMKVEREIAIMKLIHHPHVLGLHDVYENNTHLYLVLEHVSGGELFDYLVRKGRLSEREARRFFRQIVSAVNFCHKHKICHRDLKPENLLLDEHKNIKVADYGMASLQVGEKLLETSCGSPHYACPEVIRGEHYDGRKADVWSCGVILFALLVGALPFDDDNLRVLLEKVKKGHFVVPPYVPSGAQELLRGMVEVNAHKRMNLDQVMRHHWFRGAHDRTDLDPVPLETDALQMVPLSSSDDIDPDIFRSMTSLGCFRDKHALITALLQPEANEEQIIYALLIQHKERQPSLEDEASAHVGGLDLDPPRKRVDSRSTSLPQLQFIQRNRSQSIGSANLDQLPPRSPRLASSSASVTHGQYSPSSSGYYTYSSTPPSASRGRKSSYAGHEISGSATLQVPVQGPPQPGSPWKRKLSKTMKNFMGSPKFHRRKMEPRGDRDTPTELFSEPSPPTAKRSWFANFRSTSEKEREEVVAVYRDKSFQELKANILQALRVVNCHFEELSENMIKIKYEKSPRQRTKNVFKGAVKLSLTVMPTQRVPGSSPDVSESSITFDGRTFTVTFTQISGPTRRFRRVCEKLQVAMVNPGSVNPLSSEFLDYDNPSLSSDDTLALHMGDPSPTPQQQPNGAASYDSTDDCESDEGGLEHSDLED